MFCGGNDKEFGSTQIQYDHPIRKSLVSSMETSSSPFRKQIIYKNGNQQSIFHDFEEPPTIKPQPREFYLQLIQTEKNIQKGNFAYNEVTNLIEMYTKCIEYFDSVQDPIKCYFEDKLSSSLSSSSILSILFENTRQKDLQNKKKNEIEKQSESQNQEINDTQVQQISPSKSPSKRKLLHIEISNESSIAASLRPRTLSQQKKQERMKAQHNMDLIKVQQNADQEKLAIFKEQEKREKIHEQCKLQKKETITNQEKIIQDRIKARKQKNLFNQSEKILKSIAKNSEFLSSNFNNYEAFSEDKDSRQMSSRSEQLPRDNQFISINDFDEKGTSNSATTITKYSKSYSDEMLDEVQNFQDEISRNSSFSLQQ